MRLREITYGLNCELTGENVSVKGVEHDSRKIKEGDLYVCLKGKRKDGERYIEEAENRGAAAILTETLSDKSRLPQIVVDDARRAYAAIAANYYKRAHERLTVIGVVGTNGKSSTAQIIYDILTLSGRDAGLIGTTYTIVGKDRYPSEMTTPDPMQLHSLFAEMVAKGIKYAVMEASAHAIYLKKIYGITFENCVFTNISQDHLDYFSDMEEYKRVKMSIFESGQVKKAVVNADDACGREIISRSECISYGIDNPSDCFAACIEAGANGIECVFNLSDDVISVKSALHGDFNVYNLLAASVVCKNLGLSAKELSEFIPMVTPIDGRFNVRKINGINFIIDYAHTPDGFKNILKECRKLAENRLIAVFGCGGDRDRLKRAVMGSIADEYADAIILTSDNPRSENRDSIIEEIYAGIKEKSKVYKCAVRNHAIAQACAMARSGDAIVIAGKGAENYIEEGGKKYYYSDRETVENCMGVKW